MGRVVTTQPLRGDYAATILIGKQERNPSNSFKTEERLTRFRFREFFPKKLQEIHKTRLQRNDNTHKSMRRVVTAGRQRVHSFEMETGTQSIKILLNRRNGHTFSLSQVFATKSQEIHQKLLQYNDNTRKSISHVEDSGSKAGP